MVTFNFQVFLYYKLVEDKCILEVFTLEPLDPYRPVWYVPVQDMDYTILDTWV